MSNDLIFGIAIDGGGVLGGGVARFLAKIEEDFKKMPEVDFYAGTSAGSILACAYASGMPYSKVSEMFKGLVQEVFEPAPWWWKINPWKPKFRTKGLESALKKAFGNSRMTDLEIPVFVPVSDFTTGKPKVYDNGDSEFVWEVVLRSCSAPTFFPPNGRRFVDGGLWANNPTMAGITGYISKSKYVSLSVSDFAVLSLSPNGPKFPAKKIGPNMLKLEWAEPIIDFSLYSNEEAVNFYTKNLLSVGNYMRIDPEYPSYVSSFDPNSYDDAVRAWVRAFELQYSEIVRFLSRFVR